MKKIFLLCSFCVLVAVAFSQTPFEGTFSIEFKNDKGAVSKMTVKVKDQWVRLKSTAGGNSKYDYYLLNLHTRDFFTISQADKKIVIKYNVDTLLEWYEKNELKEGFFMNPSMAYKTTDKTKEENGLKVTRYTGENEIYRTSLWLASPEFNFNKLIPLLRLLGCWNEAQPGDGLVTSAEVNSKVSTRQSAVSVSMKKESVGKEVVELPKNYLQKDFSKLMTDEKENKDLNMIIQTFAGF